jgi:hypothetical protein
MRRERESLRKITKEDPITAIVDREEFLLLLLLFRNGLGRKTQSIQPRLKHTASRMPAYAYIEQKSWYTTYYIVLPALMTAEAQSTSRVRMHLCHIHSTFVQRCSSAIMPSESNFPLRTKRAAHVIAALVPLALWAAGIYVAFRVVKAWREHVKVGKTVFELTNV